MLHDIFGAVDVDGTGELWEYEDSRALRIADILIPNTTWTASEWEIASANYADCDPGTHHGSVPIDTIPTMAKLMEVSGEAKMVVLKVGAEYQATDKLVLRMGALKYAPLSGSGELKIFDPGTGELDDVQKYTGDAVNTGNMIIGSFGVGYKFNQQMTLEYGYVGGKYLYNQNAMNLVTELAAYGSSTYLGAALFTPLSFTKHVFSVKYTF